MKRAIAFILGFGLALLVVPALAEDVTLTWSNPTEQESCVDAGPTTIDGVNIWQLIATVDYPVEDFVIEDQLPGTYTYTATAFNASGESRNSGHTTKTVSEFVTIATTVYYPVPQPNSILPVDVGSVPLGTPCNPDLKVGDYYAVDRAAVSWVGNVQPLLVVAECG